MAHMRRLTQLERQIIEIFSASGRSNKEIGRMLGRDRRVIDREIKRNKPEGRAYTAKLAQDLTLRREAKRCKKKLEKDEPLRTFVVEKLLDDFSPEQIAGVLKDEPPEHLKNKSVSHESIYQYVYEGGGRYGGIYKHLRRSRKKRKKQGKRKHRKTTIQERISIHDRPSTIDDKERFGDFECDLIEGPRADKQALSVHYERKSQTVKLYRVADKTALETYEALLNTIELFPKGFVKSITFDNGSETAMHHILRYEQGIDTFHCDPYCSWQKGGVENINGLIRQYIPKGAKISEYTDKEIKDIENKLNNRPRKSHKFKTPNQVLAMARGGH
ncbi:MAG: IS30 family transposase [Patescibacteria group bacterium]